jgi:hypothetical protein
MLLIIPDLDATPSVSSICAVTSWICNNYCDRLYAVVSCCQSSKCVNLKVIDGGPGCSVEDSAHKQVVDASYSACKYFTGSTSCGS